MASPRWPWPCINSSANKPGKFGRRVTGWSAASAHLALIQKQQEVRHPLGEKSSIEHMDGIPDLGNLGRQVGDLVTVAVDAAISLLRWVVMEDGNVVAHGILRASYEPLSPNMWIGWRIFAISGTSVLISKP